MDFVDGFKSWAAANTLHLKIWGDATAAGLDCFTTASRAKNALIIARWIAPGASQIAARTVFQLSSDSRLAALAVAVFTHVFAVLIKRFRSELAAFYQAIAHASVENLTNLVRVALRNQLSSQARGKPEHVILRLRDQRSHDMHDA
jgi:hypothetical protein